MDMEQIIKQLDWLNDERRRDKDAIAALQDQVLGFQRDLPKLMQQTNALESEITQMKVQFERMDQLELALKNLEVDFSRHIEELSSQINKELDVIRKNNMAEIAKVMASIGDVKKMIPPFADYQKQLDNLDQEDHRLTRLIAETEKKLDKIGREDEDQLRVVRMLEEGRRQDNKRIIDLQAENDAFRKRLDEQRAKIDLVNETTRKYDGRLADLKNGEKLRQQEHAAFMEKQALRQVEQEREWKDIRETFTQYATKFALFEQKMAQLSLVSQSLERSQNSFDDVNERLERRIHEITEMQRLSAERVRQDWEAFQSGDQKRWANYQVKEEERRLEIERQMQKSMEEMAKVDRANQNLSDLMVEMKETRQAQLQSLLELLQKQVDGTRE